jgi:capsid protein
MVYQLCRPVYARWLDLAVLSGALSLPGYEAERPRMLAADWLPTKWDWVDPLKDANAEIAQIEAGLKSRTQAIAERGYDAEQVDREIAAERERERALGLDFRRPGSPAQGVQAMPAQGEQPNPEDETYDAEDRPRPDEDQR